MLMLCYQNVRLVLTNLDVAPKEDDGQLNFFAFLTLAALGGR